MSATNGRPYKPTPKLVQMSPALAEKILEANTLNRPLRSGRVERYVRDMAAGDWDSNGETVKITKDGQLLDGQHRLYAVIESGVTVEMLVVEGLDPKVMSTIDTGAPRSLADVLSIQHMSYATQIASTIQWVTWYNDGNPLTQQFRGGAFTHAELLAALEDNADLMVTVPAAYSGTARKILTPSVLCFVFTMMSRIDQHLAEVWLQQLATGADLSERHPVLQLRDRLLSNRAAKAKISITEVAALAIKSWNQLVAGKRTVTLRWSEAEKFPEFAKPARSKS